MKDMKSEMTKSAAISMLKKLEGIDLNDVESITISLVLNGTKMKKKEYSHDDEDEEEMDDDEDSDDDDDNHKLEA